MNKRIIFIIVFGVIIVFAGIQKLIANKKEVEAKLYIHDAAEAILVETEKPSIHTFDHALSFLGTFEANKQNMVGSETTGKIIAVLVNEGDQVSQGQVIARVDNEQIQLQLQALELNIANLKNDNERYASLKKEQAVSHVEVEKMELALKTAEVQLKQLQKQLRNTAITAAFSGTVSKRLIDLGSMVMPGTPVVELTDISSLKLTISVPERDVLKFKKGDQVDVSADVYGDERFSGTISNIGIQADASHNFKIQVTIQNSGSNKIMAGMYGSANLRNSKSISALAIHRKALIGSTKDPKVYVMKNGKAVL